MAVQIHKTHHGSFRQVNSLPLGDFVQGLIDVRQMDCRDVANERADDFVITHPAMQPAEEQDELHARGKYRGQNGKPGCGYGVL